MYDKTILSLYRVLFYMINTWYTCKRRTFMFTLRCNYLLFIKLPGVKRLSRRSNIFLIRFSLVGENKKKTVNLFDTYLIMLTPDPWERLATEIHVIFTPTWKNLKKKIVMELWFPKNEFRFPLRILKGILWQKKESLFQVK